MPWRSPEKHTSPWPAVSLSGCWNECINANQRPEESEPVEQMTVATLGNVAIISDSGEQYLRAINTKGMNRDTLADSFIGAIQAEPSRHPLTFQNPYPGGHTLACLATHDCLLSHVVLFGVFYATFITRNPSGYGGDSRVFFINPASREYNASDFSCEVAAGRIKGLGRPTSPSA